MAYKGCDLGVQVIEAFFYRAYSEVVIVLPVVNLLVLLIVFAK